MVRLFRSLQAWLLLSYGLILILAALPALFVAVRFVSLNQQIGALGETVKVEASTGTRLFARVAAVQQSVDRYLQQPQTDYLLAAQVAQRDLVGELRAAEGAISDPASQDLLASLAAKQRGYQQTFEDLSGLLSARGPILDSLNATLERADQILGELLVTILRSPNAGALGANSLNLAQGNLRQANLLLIRMVSEQNPDLGAAAIEELDAARLLLEPMSDTADAAGKSDFDTVLSAITLATSYTQQLILNLRDSATRRDMLMNHQGVGLQSDATRIEELALVSLNDTAASLARQSGQIQQIVGVALLVVLILALILGSGMAHQITEPLGALVAATGQINQGQYDTVASGRGPREVAHLADAFNQMTVTLGRQRDEVRRQQDDLARRNGELERALAEVSRASAEREAMAETVRALSVPVVPILSQVVMVPLVGEIDEARAVLLLDRLLAEITAQRARIAILDVTGVPVVDEVSAAWLLRATSAARLLGASCFLVGIRPEMAETLVASGVDLSALRTYADMRSAVEASLQLSEHWRGRVVPSAVL